ncbi:MAG: hypothetical protein GY719_36265 [bacterium]|nr:hypothetical protein [bacterium]
MAADDPAEADRLRVLRVYLMIHAPFELLWDSLIWESRRAYNGVFFGVGLLLCLGLSFLPGRTMLAMRLFVGFQLSAIVWLFPAVSNHFFLVFFCLLLLSILDLERRDEALLGLQACRLTVLIVFFYTGVQKALYGTYFKGQLLTWTIAHDDRFRTAFEVILPADEARRIAALADTVGPFGTEWWPLLVISNFVVVFELLAPFLLLHPRTRSAAVAAVVVFMVLIESGAREWFFGCVFVNLLFLFTRRSWYGVLLPLTLVFYAFLLYPRLDRVWGWF